MNGNLNIVKWNIKRRKKEKNISLQIKEENWRQNGKMQTTKKEEKNVLANKKFQIELIFYKY